MQPLERRPRQLRPLPAAPRLRMSTRGGVHEQQRWARHARAAAARLCGSYCCAGRRKEELPPAIGALRPDACGFCGPSACCRQGSEAERRTAPGRTLHATLRGCRSADANICRPRGNTPPMLWERGGRDCSPRSMRAGGQVPTAGRRPAESRRCRGIRRPGLVRFSSARRALFRTRSPARF